LSAYQGRGAFSLQNAALLLGLPGKLGFSGDHVWDACSPATWSASANTARPTFSNTYLIYLRFEMMRGRFTRERYAGGEELDG